MRNAISIWACLALLCTNVIANSTEPSAKNLRPTDIETAKKDKKVIAHMADRSLQLRVNSSAEKLMVSLSGSEEELDWVIFKPKGEVISRISTSSKIDEIEIANLDAGKYVLMIRDSKNRTLFKAFSLN